MRENKIKKMMRDGKPVINGWLQIPSTVSAEAMAHQGWDSLTIDMQHGLVDYSNALPMLQTISSTDVTPLARVNWNEPGQIMKILDAGCYGIICPMVSNKEEAERFVQACMYPPKGYRSFGPIRGLIYGGSDYGDKANEEILKFAMIETKEALDKLDEIMSTPGVDGIYIGPADLSLAIGEKPSFDNPEGSPQYKKILHQQIFQILNFGNGFTFNELYAMPVYLRNFYYKELADYKKTEQEKIKKANQKIKQPNIRK